MGRGIAQTLSLNNYKVHIFDISDDLLSQNNEKIKTNLNKLCSRDKIPPSSVKSALSNISLHLDMGDAMNRCDLVIEAVPENLELKIKVLQDSDEYSDDSTIFVSNTSGLPITLMAESISRPERLLGMHWFNPPYLMKLIEIIKCKYTDDDVFNIIINLVKQLGKSPIIVKKDIRGFIANRVYRSIRYESFINILNGISTPSEIDSAFRYKCGFPLGPIELSDFTGSIDIETQETLTIDSVRKKIPTWEPHDSYLMFRSHSLILAKKYYDSGLLGVKTGKGFYNYPSPGNWVKINLEEQLGDSVDPKSIIAPAINLSAWMIENKVCSHEDIDLSLKLGYNLPKGLLELADYYGIDEIVSILEKKYEGSKSEPYGKFYKPQKLLTQLVTSGKLGKKSGTGFYSYT